MRNKQTNQIYFENVHGPKIGRIIIISTKEIQNTMEKQHNIDVSQMLYGLRHYMYLNHGDSN